MYKLTLVLLSALSSLVFAIPDGPGPSKPSTTIDPSSFPTSIPDNITRYPLTPGQGNDEQGNGTFFGYATIFNPDPGTCSDHNNLSVGISFRDHLLVTDFPTYNITYLLECPGIPVDVFNGTKLVTAMITNYCDNCYGDDIQISAALFEKLANSSEVQTGRIPVVWSY